MPQSCLRRTSHTACALGCGLGPGRSSGNLLILPGRHHLPSLEPCPLSTGHSFPLLLLVLWVTLKAGLQSVRFSVGVGSTREALRTLCQSAPCPSMVPLRPLLTACQSSRWPEPGLGLAVTGRHHPACHTADWHPEHHPVVKVLLLLSVLDPGRSRALESVDDVLSHLPTSPVASTPGYLAPGAPFCVKHK